MSAALSINTLKKGKIPLGELNVAALIEMIYFLIFKIRIQMIIFLIEQEKKKKRGPALSIYYLRRCPQILKETI